MKIKLHRLAAAVWICFVMSILCIAGTLQFNAPIEVQAATAIPATPKLISVKPSGTSKAIVKWKAVKNVSGYRIYRSTNGKKWKAVKTLAGANKTAYTDSRLKAGTRYYYTVRAYKKVKNKNLWSGYNKKGLNTIAGLNTLKLNKTSLSLYEGKSYNLKVNGTKIKPTWKSSNTRVAVVASSGKVTAKKKGTATITAILGGRKITCKVTVKSKKYINASKTSIQLNVGDSKKIKITSSDKTLWAAALDIDIVRTEWSNAENGYYLTITGKNAGTTTIRIKNAATNPTLYRDITVTVKGRDGSVPIAKRNNLKKYIDTKGKINKNGNRFINIKSTEGNKKYAWTIVHERNANYLTFIMSVYSKDPYGYSRNRMEMNVPVNTAGGLEIFGTDKSFSENSSLEMQLDKWGEITPGTFSKNTFVNFNISRTYGIGTVGTSVWRQWVEEANSHMQKAFTGWQQLLKKTKLSMKDIGFTRY